MASDHILVNYPGMEDAANFYTSRAADLRDMTKNIKTRNGQLVSSEWNGEAALAFQERFETDHAVNMEKVAQALDEIASFIRKYVSEHQSGDSAQASAIR